VHNDSCKTNGYCALLEKPVNKTDAMCKEFERSHKEERIVASGNFYNNRAFVFANNKKRNKVEKRNLKLRIIEIALLLVLVLVTIYFGIN